jgi:hypothetical protein
MIISERWLSELFFPPSNHISARFGGHLENSE